MHYLCLTIQSHAQNARSLNAGLMAYGLKSYHVTSLRSAATVIGQWRFDVILLDADGFGNRIPEMLAELRDNRVPIVLSTSALEEDAQISRLEEGATALVPKSSSLRLTALRLRRMAELCRLERTGAQTVVRLGPLAIDTRRNKASVHEQPIDLSLRQFEILLLLATNAGEFVHRQDMANMLRQGRDESSRSVDMHISRIRKKLREIDDTGLILSTVHGLGYCLTYRAVDAGVEEEAPRWLA